MTRKMIQGISNTNSQLKIKKNCIEAKCYNLNQDNYFNKYQ